MPRVEVEAIVTTSHPVSAYGGVFLDDDVLHEMAAELRSGRLPLLAQHDLRRPMDAVVLEAQVRDRSDGYKEVWARFLVDAEQWGRFDEERMAAGAPGGFSFSCSEPLTVLGPSDPEARIGIVVSLAADASHWPDAEILAAAETLRTLGEVKVGRRYEFSHDPGAVVVLEVLGPLVVSVVANAVYDALKRFLRRVTPTIFHFHVEQDGRVVNARLETDDAEVLRRALETFDKIVAPSTVFIWHDEEGQWKPM